MEIWKDIRGFEGYYQISNYGRVKSLKYHGGVRKNPKILKGIKNSENYIQVELIINNVRTRKSIHRLVAEYFLSNPNNYPIINHKDENPCNNHVDNLEWCTYKYNSNYGNCKEKIKQALRGKNGGKAIIQYSLNNEFIAEYPSLGEAARITGFGSTHIRDCCLGYKKDYRTKKTYPCTNCKGYIFKYKNGM